jgi:hypothetical protein
MKINIKLVIFFIFCSVSALAQKPRIKPNCDFLGPLHFKNGKASVVIKATYSTFTESNDPYILESLSKKKILDGKKYYNVNFKGDGNIDATDIDFVPENCQVTYYATVAKKININKFRWLQTIYMTCTVYEGIKNEHHQPYFTVENITYKKEEIPKADNIAPFIYLNKLPHDDNPRWFSNAEPDKCVLYVTPGKAIAQTSDHKYHYFNFAKHIETKGGYIDLYKKGSDLVELNINRVIDKNEGNTTIATGQLTLTVNKIKTSFRVAGMGNDTHQSH